MGTKVGIIGAAGTLGSCAAFAILNDGMPDELWLFDINRNLLQSHYMDLQTAASVASQTSIHVGQSNEDLAGCDVVVVAAGAPWHRVSSRMEFLNDNIPIVRSVAETLRTVCPQAVVITATNPVDPINYLLHAFTGIDRRKLLGYTINDSYRFRMLAARALGTTASRVDGIVGGEHGEHQVLFFSTLKVDGKPVSVSAGFRDGILAEIPRILAAYESLGTGRTAGWTSAVGIADMVRAILRDTHEVFPCSVNLDGEYGRRGFSACVPARLGRRGLVEVQQLRLPREEQAQLELAFDYLEATAGMLHRSLSISGYAPDHRAKQ
jgi:malate/lactate dehydrogenase